MRSARASARGARMRRATDEIIFSIPREVASIATIRERLRETAVASCANFSAQSLHEWCAVVIEAVGNIIRHNVATTPSSWIAIALRYAPHRAICTSVDAGTRYQLPPRRAMVASEAESGRGFAMIYAWCAHIRLRRVAKHNILRLTYVDRHAT